MRTIGFRSNILFAIAAAIGVVASLGRPWYGPSPPAAESAPSASCRARWRTSSAGSAARSPTSDGTTGWAALSTADRVLAGLAAGTVVLLMLTMVPPLQMHVQVLAR